MQTLNFPIQIDIYGFTINRFVYMCIMIWTHNKPYLFALLMNETESIVSNIYVRPCVDGNSSTGQYFNFSVSFSRCHGENCTTLNALPGASIISPVLLSLTGISGQIAALIYLHRGSRPSSHRTTFYVMLTTLIWTDLIGKLITTPLPVLSYIHGHWFGGDRTCKLHGFSMSMIGIVTHLLVAAMAVERYLGIRCGYFYNRNVTLSRTRVLLIGIWLFGAIYCSLPFTGFGEFKLHYPGSWCHINQHICSDHPLTSRIFGNLYSTINLGCLFIIVFCNFVVVGTLLKMRVTKYRPSNSCRRMSTKKPREREIQMVILLVIITITFICSWAPHDLLVINNQIWPPPPNKNPLFDMRAIRLVSINQIVDPWTYIICRIIFRSKLWGCCRKVIIGKVGSMRFTGRVEGEENSSFYGIAAPRLKFSSLQKMQKRSSLPNPSEIEMQANLRREKLQSGKHSKPSLENSLSSVSEQDCKIDLMSCFPPKWDSKEKAFPFSLTFAKLFEGASSKMKTNSKEDSSMQSDSYTKGATAAVHNLLSSHNVERSSPMKFLNVPFCGTNEKRMEGNVSCGDLVFKDDGQFPLLQGFECPPAEVLTRSNSWCCSDEYTLTKKKQTLLKVRKK